MRSLFAVTTLLILDFMWIYLYMGKNYQKLIPRIQGAAPQYNGVWALVAYSLMVLGLLTFVLPNVDKNRPVETSLEYGAVFGLVVYGIYDATCGAVFKDWDVSLAIVDILWGSFVYFCAAYASSWV